MRGTDERTDERGLMRGFSVTAHHYPGLAFIPSP